MSKHTPGPWHWVNSKTDGPFDFEAEWDSERRPSLRAVSERKKTDGSPWELLGWILDAEPMQHGNDAANAHLIAAAPDLLAALECLLRDIDAVDAIGNYGTELMPGMYQAHKAIAKAKGVKA